MYRRIHQHYTNTKFIKSGNIRFLKRILFVFFFSFALQFVKAQQISGGEMFYRYIGPGAAAGSKLYDVTLRLIKECDPANPLPANVTFGVFINGSNTVVNNNIPVAQTSVSSISLITDFVCIVNKPTVCYEVALYSKQIDLPSNATGYTVSYQTCCRMGGLSNILNTGSGATYLTTIPGTDVLGNNTNSSPVFDFRDTVIICQKKKFTLPFSGKDPDGDSLSYNLCNALVSTGISSPGNVQPLAPPYDSATYATGFAGTSPLGSAASINPSTGIITGAAPTIAAGPGGSEFFVVTVCISEWRNKALIAEHRKDVVVRVTNCDFAEADLSAEDRSCKSFQQTFQNQSPGNEVRSWFWDFGVPSLTNDTSNLTVPTYTYADTGLYNVMLIVNRGEVCTDTAYSKMYIYPGFFPGFTAADSCTNKPIQFTDTTKTTYGFPSLWQWDFRDPASLINNYSNVQNPVHAFTTSGTHTVFLIVESSKGCLGIVSDNVVTNDLPFIQLTNDTLICSIDTLQLNSQTTGTIQWSPAYNISNTTIANPLVSPDVKTKYFISVSSGPGCFNQDSVIVDVKDSVTLALPRDTIICRGDSIKLQAVTDGLYFAWSPPNSVPDATVTNAIVAPNAATTLYTFTSSIGKCFKTGTITVKTTPYPVVSAGADQQVCFGDTALLTGSGTASVWLWSPARFLGTPTRASTTAYPVSSMNFIVRGTDTLGCPKSNYDTVFVKVLPAVSVFAGNDTSVVIGQPLQFNATGANTYQWFPPAYLSDPLIPDPVAVFDLPNERLTYIVNGVSTEGCLDSDTINIRIFKTKPGFFVPTAFTPDANGLNDDFIPVAVGISKLDYFRVFNRWGNELYSTNTLQKGWNGTYRGIQQEAGTYVWMVSGVDYTGSTVVQKGTVVLIR